MTVGRIEKMSKSKRNTVDPSDIMTTYGADAARLFILSDSPPERDLEWTESGIEGAWKYVNRLHRLVTDSTVDLSGDLPNNPDEEGLKIRTAVHKAIDGMTEDLERLHFNRAVARIRELSNDITAYESSENVNGPILREAFEALVQLIAPIMPHLAEELWQHLGHDGLVLDAPWPKADQSLLQAEKITIAVQVNGKVRATITLPQDADKKLAEETALADENVQRAIDGKDIRKLIVVPNRIVNVVV